MNDRSEAIYFTKGVLDRLREFSKKLDPVGWAEGEKLPLRDEAGPLSFHEAKREIERRERLIKVLKKDEK